MDRNPISDLEAVAAMPGLEELGEVIAAHVEPGRGFAGDPMSMLIFLAGRIAFGSANKCDSVLRTTPVWEMCRQSATSVGRTLPESQPTFSKLFRMREAMHPDLPFALRDAFPAVAVPLARSAGLLDPEVSSPWHRPHPSRVISSDGSVVTALSDVEVDANGELEGSRAASSATARIPHRFEGKGGKDAGVGLPISMVSCHGRNRWQRVVLGFDQFRDGDEIHSSLRMFEEVIALADGGVTHVVYDGLIAGPSHG